MKRILFVDDEPRVLDGLKRMLYPFRNEWQMVFVTSGLEALKKLDESDFDVLVTDLRMPEMSGTQLLSEVLKRHPEVVRMVLSGMADKETMLPSVMLAHQCLDKPCDAATLRAAVDRASNLRILLGNAELKQLVSRIQSLPSVPLVYTQLIQALQLPDVSPKEIGGIISQDLAMSAKILQLVNSSFFGVRRSITNPTEAVIYLGVDTVKALALTISVFSQFDTSRIPGFSIEALRDHGLTVGTLARRIACSLHLSKSDIDDAYLGGLMHELGKLVLACNCPRQYEEVMRRARQEGLPTYQVELQVFGTTHAEVGAYLLWLWGLPDNVTEVVARYYQPSPEGGSGSLVAVYVADELSRTDSERGIDRDWLKQLGLIDQLPAWKQLHDQVISEIRK